LIFAKQHLLHKTTVNN